MKKIPGIFLTVFVVSITFFIYQAQVSRTTIVQNGIQIINAKILKDQWKFSPETITISGRLPAEIRIYNEDVYPHGFFIAELNINESLAPLRETVIRIVPQGPAIFGFYCSVLCGDGHYRMSGKLVIEN